MKKVLILLALISSPAALAITPPAVNSFTQSQIFSNWLLSRCAGKVSAEKAFTDDAFKSASAWLEASHLPVDAFTDGDKLISAYLKMNLTGSVAGNFNMMKCTLLSQSKDANALYNKYKK
ncbi:T6SS amidase immunity protein Tai4 family protein [Pantoea anthophila]|uniref:T6SS amidase immunity protein Tai4 family protein n=1 Tax=Pantoea anthophila TaxID=470931 RepID=UPI002DB76C44|nr:T6SS amidase immunity protein Tai4 family protein [Pantoea anthophila]MEB5704242.1 type VI secretion system amidase immunity protein Tai4 [Pantoea anthophila]MEB6515115.1 type VI secretion system amidase immunity protein Tai4 [Pantoea anthophila]